VVAGRKLVGSAQYREEGVVLQHGSLLFADDQGEVAALVGEEADAPAVLGDYVSPLPPWEEVTAALAAGWRSAVGGALAPAAPSEGEARRAAELARRYADPAWTWRR